MQNPSNFDITQGINPVVSTISIPIRLVLSSISESEASGSALVTPVQSRKRAQHGLPLQHPHRRRKVSAPPELQPHFGGPTSSPATPHHGGANPSSVDNAGKSDFIFSLTPSSYISEGLYGGSDSGVTSEYSSYAHPVSGIQRQGTSSPDDDLTSPVDSIDDLDPRSGFGRSSEPKYYTSDSECESSDMNSPFQRRKSVGVTNPAYVNTEGKSVTVNVGGPPPLSRSHTDTNLTSPVPSISGSVMPEPRRNSMVVQLSLANQQNAVSNIMPRTRSISMVSLNTAGSSANNQPISAYPNLASLRAADTQSIYSEVGNSNPYPSNYKNNYLGSQMGHQDASANPDPEHNDEPESTPPEKKKEWFFNTLSENLSLMYGVFIFIFAVVIYLADTFSGHDSAMAESFNVYLIIVQLLWLGYVHVDVRRYLKKIGLAMENARESTAGKTDQVQLEPTADGQYQLRINVPERTPIISQDYGFTTGRHGGSLYLKIGATVFCFGHLIHAGLTLGQKILYLTAEDPAFKNCTCAPDVLMSVLQPIYAFYQLFFIFKYSNLIINRRKLLTRFALMHCIASSLCFWVYTILQETIQALFAKKNHAYATNYSAVTELASPLSASKYSSYGYDLDDMSDELDDMYDDDDDDSMKKMIKSAVQSAYSGKAAVPTWSINYGCEKTTNLTEMINYTTPYLYPFSIEYNILIVGIWILLWENIGRIDRHTHIPSVEVTYEEDNTKAFTSNMIIYVDCHSSNRGLFAGLFVTVATVISIILFFIFTSSTSEENLRMGLIVNGYSELIILIVMGVAAVLAFAAVRHLDILQHNISSVDDILLFICLPCIFLYAFFSMVPSIEQGEILFVSVNMLQVIQSVIQTALICDGLRRCSNSSELQQKKLGREVITFLVVANVAMWLLETFEIKSEEGNSKKYNYYGKELWTITSHLTLPLALFYRFHSSVCLADIWKASYEEEPEH